MHEWVHDTPQSYGLVMHWWILCALNGVFMNGKYTKKTLLMPATEYAEIFTQFIVCIILEIPYTSLLQKKKERKKENTQFHGVSLFLIWITRVVGQGYLLYY